MSGPGDPRRVLIGRVGRPHGIAGEVYVDGASLDPGELLGVRTLEWRGRGDSRRAIRVRSARAAHGRLLVTFEAVPDREAAAALVNGELWAAAASLPDPGPGMVYTYQLVGLRVLAPDGRGLGVVKEVAMNAGRALLVLQGGRLLPGHEPFLTRVDLAGGTLTLDLPAGFEELDA